MSSAGRRLLDIVVATAGMLCMLPLLGVLAILIKLDDGDPVFFRQTRVGLYGRKFSIWKLRTMRKQPPATGNQITVGEDPRITRVGHFLRAWKIDELPQLINVLRGDMTIVGPRPEVFEYVRLYDIQQQRILHVKPGLTSPASLAFADEAAVLARYADPQSAYLTQVLPQKIAIDIGYFERASLWSDIGIVIATLRRLVSKGKTAPTSDPQAGCAS